MLRILIFAWGVRVVLFASRDGVLASLPAVGRRKASRAQTVMRVMQIWPSSPPAGARTRVKAESVCAGSLLRRGPDRAGASRFARQNMRRPDARTVAGMTIGDCAE